MLLIIKSLSAINDKNLTLIFDEVDSGLSGKIASNIAEKINNISKKNQVIAITHSPQVASKAHKHWKIEKVIKNDVMTSQIVELSDESRINEIASLISGTKITETAKKVASGGELSRLLLIIKSLSANNDSNLTLIFDEVDSGLSGKIASNVSEKINNISKKNQVIAITHSPQVASKANKHWKIEKIIKNGEMKSQIVELNDESRVNEIASLISGAKITETAKKVASDLLQN